MDLISRFAETKRGVVQLVHVRDGIAIGYGSGFFVNQKLVTNDAAAMVASSEQGLLAVEHVQTMDPTQVWRATGCAAKRTPTAADYQNPDMWTDTGRLRSKRQGNNYCKHFIKMIEVASKFRDTVTRRPIMDHEPPIEIELERVPKRKPRPMPDEELNARMESLPPWRRDQAELSRLYGLRAEECYRVCLRHIEGTREPVIFFRGEESKSGHDEYARSGPDGWALVNKLRRQARKRGGEHLLTWPGLFEGVHWYSVWARGDKIPAGAWQPLKGPGSSWKKTAKRAGISQPHRFHDVRARAITAVSKISRSAAKGFARHQSASTTDLYIGVADDEVAQAAAAAMDRGARPPREPRLRPVGHGRSKFGG